MILPRVTNNQVKNLNSVKHTVFNQEFRGYNHNLHIASGEYYELANISTDHYPVIASRMGEVEAAVFSGHPNGLYEYTAGKLMAVFGRLLIVNITEDHAGDIIEFSPDFLDDSEKSFATIGVYTMIMPDKVIYNSETGILTKVEQRYSGGEHDGEYLIMQVVPCDIEGKTIDVVEDTDPPADNTKYWYDTTNNVYKKYSTSAAQWVQLETPLVKLIPRVSTSDSSIVPPDSAGAAAKNALDKVSNYFKTLKVLDTMSYVPTNDAADDSADWFDYIIYGSGTEDGTGYGYVILNRDLAAGVEEFTIRTKCPDLDHIVSLKNRIWGVNNKTHEIFASKLGDPMQWNNYAGIASDSYAVSLGDAEEVTAAVAYNNYPHFFTETKMIKIYGDYPSNYQVYSAKVDGVIKGGADAVIQVEGVLFYVSPIGVMAYDGSLPSFIGQKFAPHQLNGKRVCAGRDGMKYCLSVEGEGVFSYDMKTGLWSKLDEKEYLKTSQLGNAICFLDGKARLITCFDRQQNNDYITDVADNILTLVGRTEVTILG